MNWFKKLFEKDDWRFVGTVENKYHYTDVVGDSTSHTLTYYLYENQHNERKFDVIDTDDKRGDIDVNKLAAKDWVFRNKDYRNTVHPWLNGFRNPKFPTYEKVPTYDFKRLLEGDDD